MTNDQRPTESAPLPAPVTGVARGGHGTGTALDDTQLYDVADFSPDRPAAAAKLAAEPEPPKATPIEPRRVAPAPIAPVPAVSAPVGVALAASSGPRTQVPSRTNTKARTRRLGAPVAGLAGFALAAGLAIIFGVFLGGVPMPDGAAAGDATAPLTMAAPAKPTAPAKTAKPAKPDGNGGGGNNGNGNGNGRGNGNDDD